MNDFRIGFSYGFRTWEAHSLAMLLATIVRKMAARFGSPDDALIIQVMNAFQ